MTDPCPHIVQDEEGTAYCALAESGNASLAAENERLRMEIERLRGWPSAAISDEGGE